MQWVFTGTTWSDTSYSFDARPDVNAEWEQLNSLGNVHFLGVKDRSEIPVYLNGCDVLSLPLSTSFVGFPTKLYEYRSEEHTSELQSLMRISYAVFCLKKKKQ